MTESPAIELRGITKRFPGVVANDDVTLSVEAASVHALVGENGAGKSTVMKVLYGLLRPDEGEIVVEGKTARFRSPRDAIAAGIGMVHQHFQLMDNLTVLDNVILGAEPTRGFGRIDVKGATQRIEMLAAQYGLPVRPDATVANLTVGTRQRIEILKVLYRGARILILDEPTAVLVPQEVDELLASLRTLSAGGVTIIFINHKLDEVLAVSDAITVLRGGRSVATVPAESVDAHTLAELMVGDALPSPTKDPASHGLPTLVVRDLRTPERDGITLDDVSFTVHAGEIVGVAGVEGNGQHELIEALLGVTPATGHIDLGDDDLSEQPTRQRRTAGIGVIPQDRHREGLLLDAPLWENAMLGHQTAAPYAKGWRIDRNAARARTDDIDRKFGVKTPNPDVAAHALSGGNQQKLIIGRELTAEPRALIAAHPTRGIDVGAQADVWEHLRSARRDGLAVLLVSSDLEELIGLSDRLLVMLRGRIVAELDPQSVTAATLGAAMIGAG